jgi:hypothetical protein
MSSRLLGPLLVTAGILVMIIDYAIRWEALRTLTTRLTPPGA